MDLLAYAFNDRLWRMGCTRIWDYKETEDMTLQQQAYSKIDQMSDEGIKLFLDLIDKIQQMSISGFKQEKKADTPEKSQDIVDTVDLSSLETMTKEEKKLFFLKSAGNMKIDGAAVRDFHERSVI